MLKSENSLSLNSKNRENAFNKRVILRPQVDSLSKKEKSSKTNKIKLSSHSKKENVVIENNIDLVKNNIEDVNTEDSLNLDNNKRLFLKVAGVAGLGLAASALFPKSADAYVTGSTPTSNIVGVKNILNEKINPAKEDGNLANIKTNTDKFLFDSNGNLLTSLSGGNDGVVGVKNVSDTRINPATEESLMNVGSSVNDQSIWMLRKILTLLKPLGMTTGAGSNRLSVDIATCATHAVTISTLSTVTTVGSVTNLAYIGNINSFSLMKDSARNAYANGIRNNILFS